MPPLINSAREEESSAPSPSPTECQHRGNDGFGSYAHSAPHLHNRGDHGVDKRRHRRNRQQRQHRRHLFSHDDRPRNESRRRLYHNLPSTRHTFSFYEDRCHLRDDSRLYRRRPQQRHFRYDDGSNVYRRPHHHRLRFPRFNSIQPFFVFLFAAASLLVTCSREVNKQQMNNRR